MSRQGNLRSSSFLDTLLGRPSRRGSGSRGGINIPRPNSEGDFPDLGDQLEAIEQLDEDSLNYKLEELLDDMNLSEEKKQPLRALPSKSKKDMLIMHFKGHSASHDGRNKFDKAIDYINYLNTPDLSVNKRYGCLESLRIALTNNPVSWVQEFGPTGITKILTILKDCYSKSENRSSSHTRVQNECIRCLKAIMNNSVGIKEVFQQKEAIPIIAKSLDPAKPQVMLETLRIMAALCIVPTDGLEKVLEAITLSGEFKGEDRFLPIVKALSSPSSSDSLKTACMFLINAILTTPDDLELRLHLRNEFARVGFGPELIETLEKDASEDLAIQLKVNNDHREEDYDDLIQKFDGVRIDIDDVNDCFELIKNLVMDSPAEPFFLSIMQHLLFIRDDVVVRPSYYCLIEECISQIVLHRTGYDPDFRAGRRIKIDVQPVIDSLIEKSKYEDDKRFNELQQKLEEEIAKRQETEAELAQIQRMYKDLKDGKGEESKISSQRMEIGPLIPPPPPIVPPPPPPFPGGSGPPPPPPPPGSGPPPPPFGMPPPPPLAGGTFFQPPPPPDVLPFGLKPKKDWKVENIKRANWTTITPNRFSEKSFWLKVQEENLASPDIFSGLSAKFASKPGPKKPEDSTDKGLPAKKMKQLQVLDGKASQNLSILLGGSLKHLAYEDIKTCILNCDDTILTDNILECLILYLPPPEQLKRLLELKIDFNELTEAEQFARTIAGIKRLRPRLKSMKFKLHQPEMVQDIKPDIVATTAACEELKSSKKFAKILELVLLMGNYMNSGSRNGKAFAFEISFLPKLSGTKDLQNKTTLMHYLADTIERKFPELLTFFDEISHVDRASRVSKDALKKSLDTMEMNVKDLEKDLKNNKVRQSEDDKFIEVMGSFAEESRKQVGVLRNMFAKMESLYKDLGEFFAFDPAKYTSEDLFSDLKNFKDSFHQALNQNILEREAEEKARRGREAREKAEAEKVERAARKRALVKITDGNSTQEGVMDSLLEALQTGSAFSRDQRRKRPKGNAGADRRVLSRSRSRTGLISRELSAELLGSA